MYWPWTSDTWVQTRALPLLTATRQLFIPGDGLLLLCLSVASLCNGDDYFAVVLSGLMKVGLESPLIYTR